MKEKMMMKEKDMKMNPGEVAKRLKKKKGMK